MSGLLIALLVFAVLGLVWAVGYITGHQIAEANHYHALESARAAGRREERADQQKDPVP